MKRPALIASAAALALTIVPPALFAAGSLGEPMLKALMLAGALLWFVAWPLANRSAADS